MSDKFPEHEDEAMLAGTTIITWCRQCFDRTEHRYDPAQRVKLICTECEERQE